MISTAPLYQFTDCPSSETSRQQVSPPCPRTPPPVVLWGRKLLQSTRRCSPHPSNASAEMSAEAVLALIDAFCGTLGSKILGLDPGSALALSPQRSEIYGIVFLPLHALRLKLPTVAIVTMPSSETRAARQTIASDSSHFLRRPFIRRGAAFEKHTSIIRLAVCDLTIC